MHSATVSNKMSFSGKGFKVYHCVSYNWWWICCFQKQLHRWSKKNWEKLKMTDAVFITTMKSEASIKLKDTSVELTEHNQIYSSKHVLVALTWLWLVISFTTAHVIAFITSHIMTTSDWVCIWLVRTPHLGWFWHDCSWVIFKKKNKWVTMILWYETRKENLVSRRCFFQKKKVIYFVLSFWGIFEMMSTK